MLPISLELFRTCFHALNFIYYLFKCVSWEVHDALIGDEAWWLHSNDWLSHRQLRYGVNLAVCVGKTPRSWHSSRRLGSGFASPAWGVVMATSSTWMTRGCITWTLINTVLYLSLRGLVHASWQLHIHMFITNYLMSKILIYCENLIDKVWLNRNQQVELLLALNML